MRGTTPLRALAERDESGLRRLSDAGLTYADGAEERLAEIVGESDDIASDSETLVAQATDWGTTYSLTPVRANVLRALELRPDMKVLEIGCGCGPISRYLGETCEVVDSIEPMAARATVARLRTRDLDGVEVFVGTLDDVPAEPTYDVVVVVGVLEYVGLGARHDEPYLRFLRQCHAVLKDGGTLVLAIENPLGVKYIAGAVEDHTNRPFDSLEDYALASPARTFTRPVLERLLTSGGFTVDTTLGAFPDYKLPRAILADGLFEAAPSLAAAMPRFPSPDYLVARLNLADESRLWRQLVSTGSGAAFSNSFISLATKGGQGSLWPADRLGALFSTERRRPFVTRGNVVRRGTEIAVERTAPPSGARPEGGIVHVPLEHEPVVLGDELVQRLVDEPSARASLLHAWAELVPAEADPMPVDLVPHNVVVDAKGVLHAIDQEWRVSGWDRTSVLVRGLFHSAVRMAMLTRAESLAPWVTVLDAMRDLAGELGLELTPEAIDRFVDLEAHFQSVVAPTWQHGSDDPEQCAADVRAGLEQDLLAVRGGARFDQQWAGAVAQLSHHAHQFGQLVDDRESAEARLGDAERRAHQAELRAHQAEARAEWLLRRSAVGTLIRARRRWRRLAGERHTTAHPED